ncbi:hypothetical protein BpHYR1_043870 [Brachionus plicatilis]|uniref:Uncharacterized protein n=1 Tax=Brachionus plicatilis TaxID=10195 RepID=A0A3M7QIN2_BRAPC|nr:hypothetical protein BpHYR1_043870 [Brachionus plicatilis]
MMEGVSYLSSSIERTAEFWITSYLLILVSERDLELQRSLISSIIEEKQSTEIFIFHLKSHCSNSNKSSAKRNLFRFCEVQYKRTEQSFKINSVNAEWCNIQSCINCKSLLMMCKISAKCTSLDYIEI